MNTPDNDKVLKRLGGFVIGSASLREAYASFEKTFVAIFLKIKICHRKTFDTLLYMSKIDWANPEEKRKYDREHARLRRTQHPERQQEISRRYREKHPRQLMDPVEKSKSMRESALRQWAPGGSRYEKRQEKAKARELARLEKAAAKIKRHEEALTRAKERSRISALKAYHARGDARLIRLPARRKSLESAMRRVINQKQKFQASELDRLIKTANSVVKKRKRHIQARLMRILRRRFQKAFRYGANYSKTMRRLVGCSLDELRRHLEGLWQPGMTWQNYGFEGWHIDHRKPCASFDLREESQRRECFHYSNLQPLWAKQNFDNRDKS